MRSDSILPGYALNLGHDRRANTLASRLRHDVAGAEHGHSADSILTGMAEPSDEDSSRISMKSNC